jgi:hypothetical protein
LTPNNHSIKRQKSERVSIVPIKKFVSGKFNN